MDAVVLEYDTTCKNSSNSALNCLTSGQRKTHEWWVIFVQAWNHLFFLFHQALLKVNFTSLFIGINLWMGLVFSVHIFSNAFLVNWTHLLLSIHHHQGPWKNTKGEVCTLSVVYHRLISAWTHEQDASSPVDHPWPLSLHMDMHLRTGVRCSPIPSNLGIPLRGHARYQCGYVMAQEEGH